MSLESAIEEKIREAIERGDFDNLPGKGKPLDLTAYFDTPEDLRMAYSILKSNDFVPEEVNLMNEIESLRKKIAACGDETTKEGLSRELQQKSLSLRVALEKRLRK
jgi:hypothetical protein